MKIFHKMLLGFGIMLTLMSVGGIISWMAIDTLKTAIFSQHEENGQARQLEKAKAALWELRLGVALFPNATPAERIRIQAEQNRYYQEIDRYMKLFGQGSVSATDLQTLKSWQEHYSRYVQARPHWFELVQQGKLQEAAAWKAKHNGHEATESIKLLDQLISLHEESDAIARRGVVQSITDTKVRLLLVMAFGMLIGLGLAFIISYRISQATRQLMLAARELAIGNTDCPVSVRGKDELGDMAESFRSVVAYFKEAADVSMEMSAGDLRRDIVPKGEHDRFGFAISLMIVNLRDIIGRVTASAGYLSEAANRSNETTRLTSESIEEIFYSVQQISNNVDRVNESSLAATELAKNGRAEVDHTIKGMEEINSVMSEIMALMTRLMESSAEIGNIVALIDGIAKQTNLLALNATIEAARAGEQGRGFAVVADEVRQLAKHSTEEAAQISKLIQGIQAEMNGISNVTQKGDRTIREGIQRAHSAGEALGAIVKAVDRVKLLVEDINQSISEQNKSSRHIVAVVEDVVVGADNLREKARGILDAVTYFKGVDGMESAAAGSRDEADNAAVTIW